MKIKSALFLSPTIAKRQESSYLISLEETFIAI